MTFMKIQYSSNNSGGSWWLNDNDWINLEKAGWTVIWGGYYFCKDKYRLIEVPKNKKEPCKSREVCEGHRRYDSHEEVDRNDFILLGALAHDAEKEFETPREAMLEFEQITGQDVSDEGCNCCGYPHKFSLGRRQC